MVVKYGKDAGKIIAKVMNVCNPTMVQGNQEGNYSMLQPLIYFTVVATKLEANQDLRPWPQRHS